MKRKEPLIEKIATAIAVLGGVLLIWAMVIVVSVYAYVLIKQVF